jgi:hypothetical protein
MAHLEEVLPRSLSVSASMVDFHPQELYNSAADGHPLHGCRGWERTHNVSLQPVVTMRLMLQAASTKGADRLLP